MTLMLFALLPFEPFSLLTKVTHRNLPSNNYQQCSMTFILIISSMSIRTNLKKWLGFAPRQQINAWMPDWNFPEEDNTETQKS